VIRTQYRNAVDDERGVVSRSAQHVDAAWSLRRVRDGTTVEGEERVRLGEARMPL
jgi:hypothetical protein